MNQPQQKENRCTLLFAGKAREQIGGAGDFVAAYDGTKSVLTDDFLIEHALKYFNQQGLVGSEFWVNTLELNDLKPGEHRVWDLIICDTRADDKLEFASVVLVTEEGLFAGLIPLSIIFDQGGSYAGEYATLDNSKKLRFSEQSTDDIISGSSTKYLSNLLK